MLSSSVDWIELSRSPLITAHTTEFMQAKGVLTGRYTLYWKGLQLLLLQKKRKTFYYGIGVQE